MQQYKDLVEALSDAVSGVIKFLEERDIGPDLPVNRYNVMWMVATDENRSSSRDETRTEPSPSDIFWDFSSELYRIPEMEVLDSTVKPYADQDFTGLGGQGSSASLLSEYFKRVGSLAVDPQQINQVCDQ